MKERVAGLGKELIESEREIERLFSSSHAQESNLKSMLKRVGEIQADIRYTHLAAHIREREILTVEQVGNYNRLRGYGESKNESHHHSH